MRQAVDMGKVLPKNVGVAATCKDWTGLRIGIN